jgi:hypothetical protein
MRNIEQFGSEQRFYIRFFFSQPADTCTKYHIGSIKFTKACCQNNEFKIIKNSSLHVLQMNSPDGGDATKINLCVAALLTKN